MNQNSANQELKYLRLLGEQYPTIEALCTEITRISAQLSLPKGTEHFMSDLHGEYEAFCHIMNNCSGVIREKVNLWLGDQLTPAEADAFCTLIYYPEAILRQRRQKGEATPMVPGAGGAHGAPLPHRQQPRDEAHEPPVVYQSSGCPGNREGYPFSVL